MKSEIKILIEKYSELYGDFEKLQKSAALPKGDQKTGVIAEYYAKCYVESILNKEAKYAAHGNSHDIEYTDGTGKPRRIQVKGVSGHSETRTIAPLKLKGDGGIPVFEFLYLIDLGKDFIPVGFYINSFEQLIEKIKLVKQINEGERLKIVGSKMIHTAEGGKGGSFIYDFSNNLVADMKRAIKAD